MNMQFFRRGMTIGRAEDLKIQSSLMRRLVQAQDDPAKRRIRSWLCDLNDEQLSNLGLTSEDIAALRSAELENSERLPRPEEPAAPQLAL
jgi:hypothetical protein